MSELAQTPTRPLRVSAREVPANRRRGGDIRVVLSPRTVGSTSGFMGTLTLAPDEYVTEHYHPYSEEFLLVVAGRLTVRVQDAGELDLVAGEGLLVPIGRRHRVWNAGAEQVRAVFHLSPLAPRPELGHVDTEELPSGTGGAPVPDVGGPRR
ncbi:cupin domain-containing protein [Micromonospora sp. WMMA1363]|uniref:cupin domain-containing protein n=1 Tax=Micromonospora sp. WMMA1363 TaxID=3053985 RepID=UPI00259C7F0C|nr:cupin domain-containing protein [Micromonospora sp. WMMA1363]MDM4718158.1 cupin domain-containing protein [Micromonospora sp. WMMA1363]